MVKIDPKIRLSTGIKELDVMLNGGIIKNTVTLVSGPPGSGKTLLCLNFLYAGAKRGERGLYIALEEELNGIICAANSIGLSKFEKFLKDNKIVVLDIGTMRSNGEFEEILSVENILKHIRTLKVASNLNFERIAIDSISAMNPVYPTEGELRKALFYLFSKLRGEKFTIIATTEIDKNIGITRYNEAYLADTIIRLRWSPKLTDKAIYSISIPKMRYSDKSDREYQYRITDKGIMISMHAQAW